MECTKRYYWTVKRNSVCVSSVVDIFKWWRSCDYYIECRQGGWWFCSVQLALLTTTPMHTWNREGRWTIPDKGPSEGGLSIVWSWYGDGWAGELLNWVCLWSSSIGYINSRGSLSPSLRGCILGTTTTAGQMHRETIVINCFISAQVLWPTADCYRGRRHSVLDQGVYIDLSRVHLRYSVTVRAQDGWMVRQFDFLIVVLHDNGTRTQILRGQSLC